MRPCCKKRGKNAEKSGPPAHDQLVRRYFTAATTNELWLTDITEHPTGEGKLHDCAMKDQGHPAWRGIFRANPGLTHRPPDDVPPCGGSHTSCFPGDNTALETRDAKHEPRRLGEQRATWRAQAEEVLGHGERLPDMLRRALRG